MRVVITKHIEIYVQENGTQPFVEWLESLGDSQTRYRIKERLDRLSLGNYGDYKMIADGVGELRMHFGAGYRIYYAEEGTKIILLLSGGDKSSQKKDIKKAKLFWQDYKERK